MICSDAYRRTRSDVRESTPGHEILYEWPQAARTLGSHFAIYLSKRRLNADSITTKQFPPRSHHFGSGYNSQACHGGLDAENTGSFTAVRILLYLTVGCITVWQFCCERSTWTLPSNNTKEEAGHWHRSKAALMPRAIALDNLAVRIGKHFLYRGAREFINNPCLTA